MNTVTFNRQGNGLARPLPGEDHISGLIIYGQPQVARILLIEPEGLAQNGITPILQPVLHYHVWEFFRLNPGGQLYIYCKTENAGAQFNEIKELQQFASGKLRQIGIIDLLTPFAELATIAVTINNRLNELATANMPLSAILSIAIAPLQLLQLPNLHNLNCERLSICIGQDGAGRGRYVSGVATKNIGIVGAGLGAIARAKVHQSIAWVEKQNLVTDTYPKTLTGNAVVAPELDVPAFIDGTLLTDFTPAQIQSIHDKGYLFVIKHIGYTGTFFNDSYTATALDNDFCTIENNRAIDKAQRGVYNKLLPKISGPIYIDPNTGVIAQDSIASLEALAAMPLEQMERDGEISGFKIFINPNQNVLSTSKLAVIIKVVPVGVLREITVTLGFTLKV